MPTNFVTMTNITYYYRPDYLVEWNTRQNREQLNIVI